jgi:hypothetical protein
MAKDWNEDPYGCKMGTTCRFLLAKQDRMYRFGFSDGRVQLHPTFMNRLFAMVLEVSTVFCGASEGSQVGARAPSQAGSAAVSV